MSSLVFSISILLLAMSSPAHGVELLTYFQKQNPEIIDIQILDYTSSDYLTDGLLVVRGTTLSKTFIGKWENELFGVFYVDSRLEIKQALEFIPTKRWYDYCVETQSNESREFFLNFYGCTYLDQKMVRKYSPD